MRLGSRTLAHRVLGTAADSLLVVAAPQGTGNDDPLLRVSAQAGATGDEHLEEFTTGSQVGDDGKVDVEVAIEVSARCDKGADSAMRFGIVDAAGNPLPDALFAIRPAPLGHRALQSCGGWRRVMFREHLKLDPNTSYGPWHFGFAAHRQSNTQQPTVAPHEIRYRGGAGPLVMAVIEEVPAGEVAPPPVEDVAGQPSDVPVKTVRRRQKELPRSYWTLDGRPVDLARWRAGSAHGGYDTASGVLKGPQARKAEQESVLTAYKDDGSVAWEGTISEEPLLAEGIAEIHASGFQAEAEKTVERLLYQSRDYGLWQDAREPPIDFGTGDNEKDKVEAEARESHLLFRLPEGESYASGDKHSLAVWVPGTPGGITRIAFTKRVVAGADMQLNIARFTGPSGDRTNVSTPAASDGPEDIAVSNAEDALRLALVATAAISTTTMKVVRIVDLRINGIASGDTFRTDQVVADVGGRLGWDASGVQITSLNALPYDVVDQAHADVLDYMEGLDDWYWRVLDRRDGTRPYLEYSPWGTRSWDVLLEDGSEAELAPQTIFNQVVVHYEEISGKPRRVKRTFADIGEADPLAGDTRTFHFELTDPQPGSALATSVADTLLRRYIRPRWEGRLAIQSARTQSGLRDAVGVLRGDTVRVGDWGPAEAVTLRVASSEWSGEGAATEEVTLGIESEASAAGLLGRRSLVQARRRYNRARLQRWQRRTQRHVRRQREHFRDQARRFHRQVRRHGFEETFGHPRREGRNVLDEIYREVWGHYPRP